MLRRLSIRDFAIIDRLDLELGPGLTVLTGETGAGKSIILGALNAILGGRAGGELVRGGADRAVIDAVFDLNDNGELASRLEELGYPAEEGELFLTREIGPGKSTARIGGRPAAVSLLREIGEHLVDLHGQHEHQSLLSVARHLDILDDWAGTGELRARAGEAFTRLRALHAERDALLTDSRERARLTDLYRFQAEEIREAALQAGEEEELRADSRRLANAQKLAEAASAAHAGLSGEGGGVLEALAAIARELENGAALDPALEPLHEAVQTATYALQEASREIASYADEIEFNPVRLEQIEERLDQIHSLKRKYGETVQEVIAYGREAATKLESLDHSEERGHELAVEIAEAERALETACNALTAARTGAAREFAAAITAELSDLAMERTRFEVLIEPEAPSPRGADRVEMLIAPNPGEPLRPLARIASGGEISRVMLAIKGAMARRQPLGTMVFDEIDAGIGGRTGSVIGEKLAALARGAQVLCITHLPQIASRAAAHFYLEKQVAGGRTFATVAPLDADERVEELARMLAGSEVTDAVKLHAREMLRV